MRRVFSVVSCFFGAALCGSALWAAFGSPPGWFTAAELAIAGVLIAVDGAAWLDF